MIILGKTYNRIQCNKIRETGWKAAYDFDKLVRNERSDRGLWGL